MKIIKDTRPRKGNKMMSIILIITVKMLMSSHKTAAETVEPQLLSRRKINN